MSTLEHISQKTNNYFKCDANTLVMVKHGLACLGMYYYSQILVFKALFCSDMSLFWIFSEIFIANSMERSFFIWHNSFKLDGVLTKFYSKQILIHAQNMISKQTEVLNGHLFVLFKLQKCLIKMSTFQGIVIFSLQIN